MVRCEVNAVLRHGLGVRLVAASVVEERRGWRWKADVGAVVLIKAAKAVDVKILLLDGELNSLATVVVNFVFTEVDEAELVLGVEL